MKEKYYVKNLAEELQEKYKQGVRELEVGKFTPAREKFTEIIEQKEDFVPAYNKLAVLYLYREKTEEAEKWLRGALELDAEFVPAITNMGSLAKRRGKPERAKKYYNRALKIDDEYGPAYNNLGVIFREEGNYKDSVRNLKKARKLGSYSVNLAGDRPFYREKGCIVPLAILIGLIVLLYFWIM